MPESSSPLLSVNCDNAVDIGEKELRFKGNEGASVVPVFPTEEDCPRQSEASHDLESL